MPDTTDQLRDRLAALLAHHADYLAAALRADTKTGLPEYRPGVDRAAGLLELHAEHLTADEETPAVRELLDSILAFEAERPDLAHARQVLGTTTGQPETETPAPVCICGHPKLRHVEDVCLTCLCGDYIAPQDAAEMIDRWRQAALQARATAAQTAAQAALSAPERQFLTFALDLAFDEMVSNDGFTDEDHAALARFRQQADEAQQPTPAVVETEVTP